MVAIEAKYHRNCYILFNCRHNELIQSREQNTTNVNIEVVVEHELLQFIKEEVTEGRKIFPLQDLTDMMTEILQKHDIQKTVNRTRLKERVLQQFPDLRKEKGIRDRVLLIVQRLLESLFQKQIRYQRKSYIHYCRLHQFFVKQFETIRQFNFKGSFPSGCEHCGTEMTFEDWVAVVYKDKPTVKFWLLTYKYQKLILMFIRSHRERKFKLMVATLKMLVPIFFALDHHNYARWVPVFIRYLESLPTAIQVEFEAGHWVITRSNRCFSSIPIDQAHEQANKRVKGVGGVIGITENPTMLERWILTGPDISCVVQQFTKSSDGDDEDLPHHEEGSVPQRFQRHVADLLDVILSRGNPFEENSEELVTLDNKVCDDVSAAVSVQILESRGQEQYSNFQKCVLNTNDVSFRAPIKKNTLLLFKQKKVQKREHYTTKYSITSTMQTYTDRY